MTERAPEARVELRIPADDLILPFQAEQADVVGFYILGTGLALFILGKVLTKATGESVRSTA